MEKGMRQLNGVYTRLYNRRHRSVGHLFQGRYKAIVIQKDSHLLEDCGYVVLNPLRAKAVGRVEQWKWSSYGARDVADSLGLHYAAVSRLANEL